MEIKQKLHIAIFPWLAYGHIMPFFEVSRFLAQKGHRVSYISTPQNINRLPELPPALSSRLSFIALPLPHVHGLPPGAESTADLPQQKVPYLKKAFDKLEGPFSDLLSTSNFNWIIHDFAPHWLPPIAARLHIKLVYFSIYSASTLAFAGSPSEMLGGSRKRLEDFTVVPSWIDYPSNVAFKLYEMITLEEGMTSDVSDFQRIGLVLQGCQAVITKSCPDFEPEPFRILNKLMGKPSTQLKEDGRDETWEEIEEWLDHKQEKSVFYVALGTEVSLSQESTHEFANGIEKCGLPFIWVVKNRPLVEGQMVQDVLPLGFEERVAGRGLVLRGWAPQLKILAHPSVGGFLTHCGWSSVIEALGFGRALILFSRASSDLGLVARLLHGKKLGWEIERNAADGSFTSEMVAESIRRVMVESEGEAIRKNAWAVREICGNLELSHKYLNEFTQFLEEFKSWDGQL